MLFLIYDLKKTRKVSAVSRIEGLKGLVAFTFFSETDDHVIMDI